MCNCEVWFISVVGEWLVPKTWDRSFLQCPCPWLSPVLLLSDWFLKIVRCSWNWAPEYSNTFVYYPEYLILLVPHGLQTPIFKKLGMWYDWHMIYSAWNQNSNSAREMEDEIQPTKCIKECTVNQSLLWLNSEKHTHFKRCYKYFGLILDHINFSISI